MNSQEFVSSTTKNTIETIKSYPLKPLRLNYLSQAILEAENEPLQSTQPCPEESDLKPVPFSLSQLSQELLEAESEPLKSVTLSVIDEKDEADACGCNNRVSSISLSDRKAVSTKVEFEHNSLDLGMSWMKTPSKTICSNSSSISHMEFQRLFATPLAVDCKGSSFTTPQAPKLQSIVQSSSDKPRIQYAMNIKSLLKTPTNDVALKGKTSSQSVRCSLERKHTPITKNYTQMVSNVRKKLITKTACNGNNREIVDVRETNPIMKIVENDDKENIKHKGCKPLSKVSNISDFKSIVVKGVTYVILSQLGRGGSSVVYHCYNPNLKCERAIKRVDLSSDTNAVGYINEVKMLERLQDCDRIITMYDYEIIKSENILLVVLERGGLDLSKILKRLCAEDKHLPMHMLIFYWMEMLYAVKQIHVNGVIHSDLKPSNFLRAEGGLKLIDFGIASCIQGDTTSVLRDVMIGSFDYISPEALTNQSSTGNTHSPTFGKPVYKVTYKSDVWSLGCILYQFVYRRTPFHHFGGQIWNKLAAIVNPQTEIQYPEVNWVPSRIIRTIQNCLKHDAKSRPSIDELIQEYDNIYQ